MPKVFNKNIENYKQQSVVDDKNCLLTLSIPLLEKTGLIIKLVISY